ncbi:MAG: hypothetical protein L6R35_002227 [Caloplaca aegaea]|nr:MAG: hypothetical protein L6R35_002227 [Caloplaca aegaea]
MEKHQMGEKGFLIEETPVIPPSSSDLLMSPLSATTLIKRSPLTTHQPHHPDHIVRRKDPRTVTETVSVTISIFDVSVLVESHFFTLTDTVYINKTVFQPLFHTSHHTRTMTLDYNVPTTVHAVQVLATPTLATTALPPPATVLAQATLTPVSSRLEGKLGGGAVAGIVVGALVGAAALMTLGWVAMRKYRNWKAKKNQRMLGVELQRRWEREQEDRREMDEIEGDRGA